MNKELLETQTLKLIEVALTKEDSSIVSLVIFARKNDLFFTELYELWYTSRINKSILANSDFLFQGNHHYFGIDARQASNIFVESFQISFRTFQDQNGFTTDKFKRILESGLFFDETFWEESLMIKNLRPSANNSQDLKNLNTTNYATWFDTQLPDKPKVKHKQIKI